MTDNPDNIFPVTPDARTAADTFDATTITRPIPALHRYYLVISIFSLILFPFVYVRFLIRYKTMRYSFDDTGVSMSWGYFFRHEVYLTYRRLQDIHVTRNIVERWMGLAKVPIQTASGTSGATMKIEGVGDPEGLRDFLYERMRGARAYDHVGSDDEDSNDNITSLLVQIRDAIREDRVAKGGDS